MRIKENTIDGVPFLIPAGVNPPDNLKDFPSSCGPGEGIGELIIPDSLLGLCITPPCWIHDKSWSVAKASSDDYRISNLMFLANLFSVIKFRPIIFPLNLLKPFRFMLAVSYYEAVASETGESIFWKLKQSQDRDRKSFQTIPTSD